MKTVRLCFRLGSVLRFSNGLAITLLLAGCSALINPDEGRLGGDFDAGPGAVDGGRSDGATADGGRDAGPTDDGGPGDDGGPTCPPSCDDSVACTSDSCVAGSCTHEANDAACSDGERCNPVLGCVPTHCSSDPECSDGLYCNGAERCDAAAPGTGCTAGTPIACNDGAACTVDACDEDMDRCVSTPNDGACADTVDCTIDACAPGGSDPSGCVHTPDASLCAGDFCTVGRVCNPTAGCVGGAARACSDSSPCTDDSCNETTDMCVSVLRDGDGDTFGPVSVSGVACGGTDCDDGNGAIHPGAPELCDGLDNNCNMTVDEGCPTTPDTCRSAAAIVLDGSGNGAARGTFSDFANDYQTNPICNASAGGRDAVYYVDLPNGTWDLTIDTIGSVADTVLAVGLDCSMADFSAACNDDYTRASISNDSRIWVHRISSSTLTPRRVYILVDAYSNSVTGDFVVNVRRRNGAPDSCPSGTGGSFPLDITGGGTVLGFQSSFLGSQRGSCQPAGDVAPEAMFRFNGDASGNADFEVYSSDFVPDIYVRTSPCGSGTELGCDIGSSVGGGINAANLRVSVASSLHYLFVDGGRVGYVVYYQPY